ncbi:CHU large protein; glucose/sorbosone dehydrogenase-related, partial [Pedobacter sp. BAL39]
MLILSFKQANAEGSKDLYPSGVRGNRAFLYVNNSAAVLGNNVSFPFRTLGTHFVYAKVGETIAIASSAVNTNTGTIYVTTPSGNRSVLTGSGGRIASRTEELAGPRSPGQGAGGNRYAPKYLTIGAGQEGVWKVEFVATGSETDAGYWTGADVRADNNWTQPGSSNLIAAWDISVRNAGNTWWLSGRVYTNVLNLQLSDNFESEDKAYYGTTYVLTKDGRAYRVKNNGNHGLGFTFFSNNKGFIDAAKQPIYKSLNTTNAAEILNAVHDPRSQDDLTNNLITHKIFYNAPSADLPQDADVALTNVRTSTWLKRDAVVPIVTNINFIGSEGTPGQSGQKGGYILFDANVPGSYRIEIPFGNNKKRVIVGAATANENRIKWDGKDDDGNLIPGGALVSEVKVRLSSAEVHFPYIDMEINPRGIIIELAENTLQYAINPNPSVIDESVYSDRVYWNDSDITGGTGDLRSDPKDNSVDGLSSNANGHKWGTYATSNGSTNNNNGKGSASYGNNKAMDTYAYILSNEEGQALNMNIKVADLKVVSIIPVLTNLKPGSPVSFKVRVKNESSIVVEGAKFAFFWPSIVNIPGGNVSVSVPAGVQSNNESLVAGAFRSSLDFPAGAEMEYTFTGTIASVVPATGIHLEASIMRPNDVTDPDASNHVFDQEPTDPHEECANGTATEACNNIKYRDIFEQDVCQGSAITEIAYTLDGGTALVTGSVPNGVTGATATGVYRLNGVPSTAGRYEFTIGTSGNERQKSDYLIHVNALPGITSQPVNNSVCEGSSTNFSVTSSGANNAYQWQYLDGTMWMNFSATEKASGFNTEVLSLTDIPLSENGRQIRVLVTSELGCAVRSNAVNLTVKALPPAPSISSNNVVKQCEGNSIVVRASPTTGLRYEWYLNGVLITGPGTTGNRISATQSGEYTVKIIMNDGTDCPSPASPSLPLEFIALPPIPNVTASASVACESDGILFTSSVAYSYQWYNGEGPISGATGKEFLTRETGSYYVEVKNEFGCNEFSDPIDVVINRSSTALDINASDHAICLGESVTLNAALNSSLSTVSPVFTWYADATLATKLHEGASYQVSPATTTIYYVTVKGNGTCENPTGGGKAVTVTVNDQPTLADITVADDVICAGASSTLTASSNITGARFTWYSDAALSNVISTNATLTVSPSTTTTYYVRLTNVSGCFTTGKAVTVTVNDQPTVADITVTDEEICAGGSSTLTATSTITGASFTWYSDAALSNLISNTATLTVSPAVTTTYYVRLTNASGCFTAGKAVTVTVSDQPTVADITVTDEEICAGASSTLTATSTITGASFTWYSDAALSNVLSNTATLTVSPVVTTTYYVRLTNASGCFTAGKAVTVTVNDQ